MMNYIGCMRFTILGYPRGSTIFNVSDYTNCDFDCILSNYRKVEQHLDRYANDSHKVPYFKCVYEKQYTEFVNLIRERKKTADFTVCSLYSQAHKEVLLLLKTLSIITRAIGWNRIGSYVYDDIFTAFLDYARTDLHTALARTEAYTESICDFSPIEYLNDIQEFYDYVESLDKSFTSKPSSIDDHLKSDLIPPSPAIRELFRIQDLSNSIFVDSTGIPAQYPYIIPDINVDSGRDFLEALKFIGKVYPYDRSDTIYGFNFKFFFL
jgi:hypothetical protein